MDHREDWRALPLVTIDPPDAKDHDDAVHAVPDEDPAQSRRPRRHRRHRRRLLVRAARAAPRSRGAASAGNSVYFPDRVVPMLPERISNDLCSLREARRPPGARRAHDLLGRRPQAQPPLPPHDDALGGQALLRRGAGHLRRPRPATCRRRCPPRSTPCGRPTRASSAAATSASRWSSTCPSARCWSPRTDRSTASSCRERLEAHRLIEEFMIQANVAAAETLEAQQVAAGLSHPRRCPRWPSSKACATS